VISLYETAIDNIGSKREVLLHASVIVNPGFTVISAPGRISKGGFLNSDKGVK
jgi:hypothetical protein